MTTEELENIIGNRPVITNFDTSTEYYMSLCRWEQKTREHETARANKEKAAKERWKTEAIKNSEYDGRCIQDAYTDKEIESIDRGL